MANANISKYFPNRINKIIYIIHEITLWLVKNNKMLNPYPFEI